MTVVDAYHAVLKERGYVADTAQLAAVERLERMNQELRAFKARRSNALKKLINRPDVPRGEPWKEGVLARIGFGGEPC